MSYFTVLFVGVLTQCVKHKNVVNVKPDLIHNLWLKVNEKLGGTNWKISVPLPSCDKPMMVVGCSFTHAEPTSTEPTMVGLCASTQQGKISSHITIYESRSLFFKPDTNL